MKIFLLLCCFFAIQLYAQTTYKLHDKVKVKWSNQWYDAEIIDVKANQYKIHYDGYGSTWDEWVTTDRIQSTTNTNKQNPASSVSAGGKYAVGDKIEAWSAGVWYPASVVAIGSDNYKGYYKVHFTNYSDASDQWLNASSVRKPVVTTVTAGVSPREGKYKILSYGSSSNPVYLGYFMLKNGSYSYYNAGNQLLGSGNYDFDKATRNVKWNSGPFKINGWNGSFEVSREGKTHIIRLKSTTIGTNSTDS